MFKFDRRRRYFRNRYRYTAIFFLVAIATVIILVSFLKMMNPHQPLLDPRGTKPTPTLTPTPDPTSDPLTYIRAKGELEGYTSYEGSKHIKVGRAESGFYLNPLAKNPNSTAKGIFQFIDGTWNQYCDGDVYNFVDNIDCFYEVLERDGYPKGLNHWLTSRSKWE